MVRFKKGSQVLIYQIDKRRTCNHDCVGIIGKIIESKQQKSKRLKLSQHTWWCDYFIEDNSGNEIGVYATEIQYLTKASKILYG